MKISGNPVKSRTQAKLGQIISIHLLVWLMSFGFALGQTQNEKKQLLAEKQSNLRLVVPTKQTWIVGTAISPNGKLLASQDALGILKIWDMKTAKELKILTTYPQNLAAPTNITFSSNNRFLIVLELVINDNSKFTFQSQITVWDIEQGKDFRSNNIQNNFISDAALSENGQYLATSNFLRNENGIIVSDTILIQNLENPTKSINLESEIPIYYLSFSPDGKILYGCGENGEVFAWNLQGDKKPRQIIDYSNIIVSEFALSNDGKRLGIITDEGNITIYNALNGDEITQTLILKNENEFFSSVGMLTPKFNSDLSRVASILEEDETRKSSTDFLRQIREGVVTRVWDTATGREVLHLKEDNLAVDFCFAFSSDGLFVARGYFDGAVKLIDVSTRQSVKTFAGNTISSIMAKLGSNKKIVSMHSDVQKALAFYALKFLDKEANFERKFEKYLLEDLFCVAILALHNST